MIPLIMKFGGAAVASAERFAKVADIILTRLQEGNSHLVIVVSAMGKTTDELMALAKVVHPNPPKREQDMLISVGERVSIALLAMALHAKGQEAISFTGSQSGIITSTHHSEALIVDVRPKRILKELEAKKVVIVAGFQGVSQAGEITTLGRGGSDTSAVALAAGLGADKVEFYKDVAGIGERDPKQFPDAAIYSTLTYEQALSICQSGAKVLHPRCISLAEKNQISLHVIPFENIQAKGTLIGVQGRASPKSATYEMEQQACSL